METDNSIRKMRCKHFSILSTVVAYQSEVIWTCQNWFCASHCVAYQIGCAYGSEK